MAKFRILSMNGSLFVFAYSFNGAPWGKMEVDFKKNTYKVLEKSSDCDWTGEIFVALRRRYKANNLENEGVIAWY